MHLAPVQHDTVAAALN